jgi:hypothetical protein
LSNTPPIPPLEPQTPKRLPLRTLTVAGILVFWLATLAWLVFYEAYPGLLDRTTSGYRDVFSRGVLVMDQWMKISFQGKRIGYSHTSMDVDETPAHRQYLIDNLTVLSMNVMGSRQRISVKARSALDDAYRLQTFSFTLSASGYSVDVQGRRVHGDTYAVSIESAASTRRLNVTIPDDALLYSPMTEMMLKSLAPGKQVTLRVFNPLTLSPQNLVIRALRRETITNRGKPVEATVLSALVEGMETLSWIDPDGAILRQETLFGWTMESCDAKEALIRVAADSALDADMLTSLAVPVTGPAGRLAGARAATLRLTGAPSFHASLESQRQHVLCLTGTVTELRLQAETLPETNLPVRETDAGLSEWLAPSPFIQCTDPRMVEKARQITAAATNRMSAALALYQWVYENVAKTPTVSLPSALDVLLRPEGDCNEHTYLFVGLARAIGIPAKIRVGLTLHNGMFYYHAWPSIHAGRWVDMDPTLGQPAVGADHLSLLEGELSEQMKLMALLGRLKVDVIKVEE